MEFDLFKPRAKDAQQRRAATIKAWVSEIFGAEADTTILVTEAQCDVPGCAPIETVIALFVTNEDEAYIEQMKVFKPLAEVTRDDIEQVAFEEELQDAFEDDVEELEDGDTTADA